MKTLLSIALLILLSGCVAFPAATYTVRKFDPVTGKPIAELEIKSRRDLEGLDIQYNREQGAFTGKVNQAISTTSPLEQSISEMLPALIYRYGQMTGEIATQQAAREGN